MGLTIVGCGSTLWLARNEGRFLPAPTSTLQCGPSAICPEHRLEFWDSRYHPDEAGDKRRLPKPLILQVKLMSLLAPRGPTNKAGMRRNFFPGSYGDSVQRAPNRGTGTGVSFI
jgi:hypothetical protein